MLQKVNVLLLSSDLDYATDRVCLQLRERDVSYLRLNRENLSSYALTLEPSGPLLYCQSGESAWSVGSELLSVWWRQGTFDRWSTDPTDPVVEQMKNTQWPAFMRSMMVFDGPRWVNHPSKIYRAETKAVQLFEASRIGFDVPETIMTNDRNAPVKEAMGSTIALKSIDTLLLREGNHQLFGYTHRESWDQVANDDFRIVPATVQRFLENKIDLRVTVLGDQVWCVSVLNSDGPVFGDWRLTPKEEIVIQDYDLPNAVVNMCKDLTQRLGLAYGAIDLAFCDGQYWFIEINPTGEWGWLDSGGRALSSSIAAFLGGEVC